MRMSGAAAVGGLLLFGGVATVAWTAGTTPAAPTGRPAPGSVPTRVLSVNITSDEILLDLAPDLLVGLSYLATDPQASNVVLRAQRIPVRLKGDVERILSLQPDLLVIGGHQADIVRQVEALGIRTVRIQGFESLDWIRELIRTLGAAVGRPQRAEELVAEMDGRLAAVARRVAGRPRPRVLSYSAGGFVAGRRTITDDVIQAAGGENLAGLLGITGWKKLSLEQVVAGDPEVIVMRQTERWDPGFAQALRDHPAFRHSRAVATGQVYLLPGRLLVTSSHHIAETVEALARLLHPEAFAGASM